jgi:hypothetical protein
MTAVQPVASPQSCVENVAPEIEHCWLVHVPASPHSAFVLHAWMAKSLHADSHV